MINFFIEYLYTLIYVVALSYVISLTYPYIRKENMLRNIMVILSYTFVLNIVTYTSPHNGWLYVIGNLMCISLDFIYCGVLVKRFRLIVGYWLRDLGLIICLSLQFIIQFKLLSAQL